MRQLHRLAHTARLPVLCYGLRSDFRGDAFPGAAALLTLADDLEEMKTIVREDGFIGAPGRAKDDRVIASGLACVAYAEQVQPRLIAAKITREVSKSQEDYTAEQLSVGRNVSDYLKRIGMYGS